MIPVELQRYLRRQGLLLKVFRCWQWLFTIGLHRAVGLIGLFLPLCLLLSVCYQNERVIWTLSEILVLYVILYCLIFIPKSVPWFLGRLGICKSMFVKKMFRILHYCIQIEPSIRLAAVLDCKELGLNENEKTLMKNVFKSMTSESKFFVC